MNLVPAFGNFDTADATPPGALVFAIDPEYGRLVEANGAARVAWGIETGADGRGPLPLALDRAMPALAELRAGDVSHAAPAIKRLTFWTRHGVAVWDCRLQNVVEASARLVRVTVVDPLGDSNQVRPPITETVASAPTFERLAHELRTPLAAIASLADVMAESRFGPLGNARYEDYARNISETARHALDVVSTMLAPKSRGSTLPEQTFTELDLCEIATDVASSMRVMAEERGLALSVEQSPPDMPRVIADRVSVQRIVLNLVRNGLEHAAGATRLVLRVGVTQSAEAWIEVEDDGPGIPAEIVSRSAKGETRPAGEASSGLGLVLTRELAQANAARLEFLPVMPNGTRVRLRFDATRSVLV